jgi:hypothetical protein
MPEIYGAPQLPLTGNESVTIYQEQNSQLAKCTMSLSALLSLVGSGTPTVAWASSLPTAPTAGAKTFWIDNGVLSFS